VAAEADRFLSLKANLADEQQKGFNLNQSPAAWKGTDTGLHARLTASPSLRPAEKQTEQGACPRKHGTERQSTTHLFKKRTPESH